MEQPAPSPSAPPRWHDPNARPLLFSYSKAFGLGFDPRDADSPFLYGGEYDGIRPCPAAFMLRDYVLSDLERCGMSWIIPFIQKAAAHQDFALSDLLAAATSHGYQPSSTQRVWAATQRPG